jgi:hypothetical protein
MIGGAVALSRSLKLALPLVLASFSAICVLGQTSPPSVSQVLIFSGTIPSMTVPVFNSSGVQTGTVTLHNAVPNIFSGAGNLASVDTNLNNTANYTSLQSLVSLTQALNAGIATSLSVIPISSPASGVIFKKDPATGGELPASSTLGPIFTERAETIGKHRFYIGFSNQDYHFTSFNGRSLNNLTMLYAGGEPTKLSAGTTPLTTYPATFNLGVDIRLSQDIAFLTYGVTNRFDLSVGLPAVHAAVAARTYNGIVWDGGGTGTQSSSNPNCWCANTLTPGNPLLELPDVGNSHLAKTGFGDLIVRGKGTIYESPGAVIALGADVRFPTGDAKNYLGAGAASFKPFMAVSFYSKPFSNGLVLSPHATLGYQYIGKSILGGTLVGTPQQVATSYGSVTYQGAPFTQTKDFLPDVLSWSVGAELALGRHSTVAVDVLGNEIGLIHGMPDTKTNSDAKGFMPCGPGLMPNCSTSLQPVPGLVSAGRVMIGEYSGAFGYKARVVGNLVVMFNALVRFDNNSLVSRFVPLYGIGYSF